MALIRHESIRLCLVGESSGQQLTGRMTSAARTVSGYSFDRNARATKVDITFYDDAAVAHALS
jgi:hypothetical protein